MSEKREKGNGKRDAGTGRNRVLLLGTAAGRLDGAVRLHGQVLRAVRAVRLALPV